VSDPGCPRPAEMKSVQWFRLRGDWIRRFVARQSSSIQDRARWDGTLDVVFRSKQVGNERSFRWIALVRASGRKYGTVVKAKVIVMPKATVLDPQGNAVRDAMRHLGMPEVRSVRIGKYMEIDIEGQNGDLESRLHRLCRDLLSNPVIEDYDLQKGESGKQEERKTKTKAKRKRE
jgi:phosphoribosylformylglycinamidine synthase PurS subunit